MYEILCYLQIIRLSLIRFKIIISESLSVSRKIGIHIFCFPDYSHVYIIRGGYKGDGSGSAPLVHSSTIYIHCVLQQTSRMSTDNDIADNQARESGGVGTSVEIGTANHDNEIKDCDKIPNAKLNHERNRGNFAHKMTNKNKRDQNQKGDETGGKKIRRRNNNSSLTISLMLITVAFLVLSISGGILNGIGQSDDPNMTVTEKEIAQLQAEIMSVLNNSMNFLFYFISGRLFRATFKKTFIAPVAKCLCKH